MDAEYTEEIISEMKLQRMAAERMAEAAERQAAALEAIAKSLTTRKARDGEMVQGTMLTELYAIGYQIGNQVI